MIKLSVFISICAILLSACQPGAGALSGTRWDLASIEGQPLIPDTHGTLEFSKDGTAGGQAGCNSFGTSSVEITKDTIQFNDLAQTEMACLDDANSVYGSLMDQESRYMQALSQVRKYKLGDQELVLFDESGKELLVFTPAAG